MHFFSETANCWKQQAVPFLLEGEGNQILKKKKTFFGCNNVILAHLSLAQFHLGFHSFSSVSFSFTQLFMFLQGYRRKSELGGRRE